MIAILTSRKEAPITDGTNGSGLFITPQTFNGNGARARDGAGNWYQALAEAWGEVLDQKAGQLVATSEEIGNNGSNDPSTMVRAAALAQEFGFTSTMASTANNSVGQGLETVSKRQ
jgi:hypothetical protein